MGDSDALAAAVFTGAFLLLSVLMINRALTVRHDQVVRWYGGAVLATLVIFGGSEYFVEKAIDGLGEIPTWLFPLGVVLVALRPVRRSTVVVMALLAGVVVAIRPNQGIGMVLSMALLMFLRDPPTWRWPLRRAVAPGVAFASVLLLLLAHNVHYGGDWIVFPRLVPGIMDLPPSDLALVLSDPDVRGLVFDKIRAMFHLGSSRDDVANPLLSPFLPMQVLWLAAVWVVLRNRGGWRYPNWMVAIWPLGYAAGHVNYTVWVYYPRHIVPFNLALMLSGLLLVVWRTPARTPSVAAKAVV